MPGHCSVWPDLTWDSCFLLSVTVEPIVCMGLKKCFSIIYHACSRAPADQIFFLKFHPTLGRNSWFLAEGQLKITAGTIVLLPPILNTFLLDVGQKWLWMHLLSDFWGGVQPQYTVILITAHFMKIQFWDWSHLENLVWTALEVTFRTVWTWGK